MEVSLYLKGNAFQRFGEFNEDEVNELIRTGWRHIYTVRLKRPVIKDQRQRYEYIQKGVGKNGIPIVEQRKVFPKRKPYVGR